MIGTRVKSITFWGAKDIGEPLDLSLSSVLNEPQLIGPPPVPERIKRKGKLPQVRTRPYRRIYQVTKCDHVPPGSLCKIGKTKSGRQRYRCRCCGKSM